MTIQTSIESIKQIECNQLGSNNPIEDRLRVSKIALKSLLSKGNQVDFSSSTLIAAVFDGHGGPAFSDAISRRLFNYIAVSILPDPKIFLENPKTKLLVQDLFSAPMMSKEGDNVRKRKNVDVFKTHFKEEGMKNLKNFAQNLIENPVNSIEEGIRRSFIQCDEDLSNEIVRNISSVLDGTVKDRDLTNAILHHYLSLSVSGSCVLCILIHEDKIYTASTGDCGAILGYEDPVKDGKPMTNSNLLIQEHNGDNVNEIKRLYAAHPGEESDVIRNERLLGEFWNINSKNYQ